MRPEALESLKVVLNRLHNNSVYAFSRVKAAETVVRKRPEMWREYLTALAEVEQQDVHRDFDSLLDKIQ